VSRFVVVPDASQLVANAHSSIHSFTYRAPLSGAIDAGTVDSGFDLGTPITGSLEVDLDLLKGDDPHTDSEMHRRVETHRYPKAKATITDVSANGGDGYRVGGSLTLHGRTQPLEGDATVSLDGDRIHAVGTIEVDVRDFEIKPPSLLILRVHPVVTIDIDLVAERATD
jgi:polyisoprenoid-binding protein YceI